MNKVDEFFIGPLEDHYETAPNEGPRDTILTDLAKYSPEELHAGAEWIKRNKQSTKSFPSPKECNAAMDAVHSNRSIRSFASGEKITKETYASTAVAYCKSYNHEGNAVVVSKNDGGWEDWISYYRSLGMVACLDLMKYRESWTFPCMFPAQFDQSFKGRFPMGKGEVMAERK